MGALAQPVSPVSLPQWALDLYYLHAGRVARQFIIHFNITDLIIDLSDEVWDQSTSPPVRKRRGDVVGAPQPFRAYLHRFLRERMKCQAIYSYSLAGGLLADEDTEVTREGVLNRQLSGSSWSRLFTAWRTSTKAQPGQPSEGSEVTDLPKDPTEVFKLLGQILRQRYYRPGASSSPTTEDENPVAVIIDYAEKLMPVGVQDGRSDTEQLAAVEVAQRWAIDPLIRETRNIVILLTTNLGQMAANIYAEGSGTRTIRVPLPDGAERLAYIRYLTRLRGVQGRVGLAPLKPGEFGQTGAAGQAGVGGEADLASQLSNLSTLTQGMRLHDIDYLNRRVIMQRQGEGNAPVLTNGDVQLEKEQVIQAQSEQLLEVVPRRRGFDDIGGLDGLKGYLTSRAILMKNDSRSPLVPMGLLLAGPPGTGKTIIAEALAKESGFNLVKMRNIQDKWVGSSERNLDLVLNLLKDLYPVVVFIDEVDQASWRRDSGRGGDTGVSGRMFARILEEMSNGANRGQILWVAATNRVDYLDDALLRRFDRVVPLLVPDEDESCRVFATMARSINSMAGAEIVRYGGALAQGNAEAFRFAARQTAQRSLTGAGIEVVVRRAAEIAAESAGAMASILPEHLQLALLDYKPNHDPSMYDLQSLLAIQACNFLSVLPSLPERPPFTNIYEAEAVRRPDGSVQRIIDPIKLADEIETLRRKSATRGGP